MTTRQTLVIVVALVESFILSAHYAVFMPFYPTVAIDKGNTYSQVSSHLHKDIAEFEWIVGLF